MNRRVPAAWHRLARTQHAPHICPEIQELSPEFADIEGFEVGIAHWEKVLKLGPFRKVLNELRVPFLRQMLIFKLHDFEKGDFTKLNFFSLARQQLLFLYDTLLVRYGQRLQTLTAHVKLQPLILGPLLVQVELQLLIRQESGRALLPTIPALLLRHLRSPLRRAYCFLLLIDLPTVIPIPT